MSTQFYNYGIELSSQSDDGAYIEFYRTLSTTNINNTDDNHIDGRRISSDEWISSDFTPCKHYVAGAPRCSLLAPFDNSMQINLVLQVGNGWCTASLDSLDNDELDRDVEMEISSIVVSALQSNICGKL